MNPFQAVIDALRAVSTVPPITTNFWKRTTSNQGQQETKASCVPAYPEWLQYSFLRETVNP